MYGGGEPDARLLRFTAGGRHDRSTPTLGHT